MLQQIKNILLNDFKFFRVICTIKIINKMKLISENIVHKNAFYCAPNQIDTCIWIKFNFDMTVILFK